MKKKMIIPPLLGKKGTRQRKKELKNSKIFIFFLQIFFVCIEKLITFFISTVLSYFHIALFVNYVMLNNSY